MGRNKDESIRKLTKIGKESYAVTLPVGIVRKFNWREKQKLQIEVDDKKKTITIKDWRP